MVRVSISRRIECPRHKVFRLFSELERLPGRISEIKGVEKLTEGPVGIGTRIRETRVMLGRRATAEMVFTDFQTDETYTVECNSNGTHYRSVYQFEPVGDKTDVNVSFEVEPLSLRAKLLAPLGWLMLGTRKRFLQHDVDALKKVAESRLST